MIRILIGAARSVFGRPAVRAWQEIDCRDGVVRIEPSPFLNGRIELSTYPHDLAADGTYGWNPHQEPVPLLPDEARQVASALIAAAQEVERDG